MAKKVIKFDEEEFNFLLIGMVSSYRDFRVCREVNRSLSIALARGEDYAIIDVKRKEEILFPFFSYQSEAEDQYSIIGNRSERGILIPEQKQIDFFLVVKPGATPIRITELISLLKSSPLLQAVFAIDVNKLKSKQNLLF
jgi:hypothetical protein